MHLQRQDELQVEETNWLQRTHTVMQEHVCFVVLISVIRNKHYYFLLDYLVMLLSIHIIIHLFIGIIVTQLLLFLIYTKLFIIYNKYTYTVIYQYHCDVIIH